MPAWLTILIGLVGTLIGAGIVIAAVGQDPAWVGIAGFLVSIALVIGYRRFVQKRALWGPDAYRFPERGVGVEEYRAAAPEGGHRSRGDRLPDGRWRSSSSSRRAGGADPAAPAAAKDGDDPTENPAHFLQLLEELHDTGVLSDDEYTASRTRLLERLRA